LRDINDIRLRGLNLDHLVGYQHSLVFDVVCDDRIGHIDDLLVSGFERATLLGLPAHSLNGIGHPFRLVDEGIAQIAGPLNVIVHLVDYLRESGDGFDIVVPRLRIELGDIVRILDEPRGLHDFKRIRRSRKDCRQQRIGINRDRRDQFVQVGIALLRRG
jgi:hypothetical protein